MANVELNVELNADTEILRAQLDTANARIKRAEHALTSAGWTYQEGAAAWKPPLGPSASPLGPSASPLLDRIAELERAQGVLVGALEAWQAAERYACDYRDTPEAQQEITDAWADAAAKRDAALAAVQKPEGGA